MEVKLSYYIRRDGNDIWLNQGVQPEPTDEVLEVRDMLVAAENKTLYRDGLEIGQVVWLQNGDTPENYIEGDMPPEPEPPEEEEEEDDV